MEDPIKWIFYISFLISEVIDLRNSKSKSQYRVLKRKVVRVPKIRFTDYVLWGILSWGIISWGTMSMGHVVLEAFHLGPYCLVLGYSVLGNVV